jgi:DNA repair exonuclease SbcCD ATPase subunit
MSRCIFLRLALAALIAAAVIPLSARAQSQDSQTQSVADAARRAREQKKAGEKQPSPVITNDTLKPAAPATQAADAPAPTPAAAQSPDAAPVSSPEPATGSASAPDAKAAPTSASTGGDAGQKAQDSPELAALKQQLAEAQKNFDFLQRELALEQDNVYSKPNSASDTAGKAKLDDLKQQLGDKQQSLEALKARLASLLGSAGSAAPATSPAPPQS